MISCKVILLGSVSLYLFKITVLFWVSQNRYMFRVNLLYLEISEANHYCQAKLPIKMRFEEKGKVLLRRWEVQNLLFGTWGFLPSSTRLERNFSTSSENVDKHNRIRQKLNGSAICRFFYCIATSNRNLLSEKEYHKGAVKNRKGTRISMIT